MSTIPFTEKDVKEYLDDCIIYWRRNKKNLKNNMDDGFWAMDKNILIASCYIDAYQSVRISLFGELLKK